MIICLTPKVSLVKLVIFWITFTLPSFVERASRLASAFDQQECDDALNVKRRVITVLKLEATAVNQFEVIVSLFVQTLVAAPVSSKCDVFSSLTINQKET